MTTTEDTIGIAPTLKADLREALDNLVRGIRDPQAAKKACERMDRMREENRKLLGDQHAAVEIIRELRDGQ